jgi:DNA-binding response OmpR family regulator/tetratricopeptide (TPR) repeat protein
MIGDVTRFDSPSVLIVDDDRSTQRLLSDALAKEGFTVAVENDGDWAVKAIENKRFQLVILDLLLPGRNGYEVAKQIRKLPHGKRLPIIMISGVYRSAVHRTEAVAKHGAVVLLEKPIQLPELFDNVRQTLGDDYPKAKRQPPAPPPPPIDEDEATGEIPADPAQQEEAFIVEEKTDKHRQPALATPSGYRGTLEHKRFSEVLAELYRRRQSGALLLQREKAKKIVYFSEGQPQLVKSNLLAECLGRILVREKMISEADCEESLRRMKQSSRMQGTVLIEMGCLSPHNLQYALQLQLHEKLFEVFRWVDGEFVLNPQVPMPSEPISLDMSCAQLIYEGIRRGFDDKRVSRALGALDDQYVHPASNPLLALQETGLNEAEQTFLSVADGHKTVSTLRALALLEASDADKLLLAMLDAQLIEMKSEPAPGRAKSPLAPTPKTERQPLAPIVQGVFPPPLPPKATGAAQVLDLPWKEAALIDAPSLDAAANVSNRPLVVERQPSAPSGPLLPELAASFSPLRFSNEDSVAREQLAMQLRRMQEATYFDLLQVDAQASREDVKRSYFRLAKEYHPDKHFRSASAEIRQLAQQIYALISKAHDTLTDPSARNQYENTLASGQPLAHSAEPVAQMLAAEGKFQRGEQLMRQRQYLDANRAFAEAIALYADEGEFHAWLGWSSFQADATSVDSAIGSIERAIALNPKLDKSYLFLGYIHKFAGRPDKAERQFEKAIQCNPDCTEALRELRLLGRGKR